MTQAELKSGVIPAVIAKTQDELNERVLKVKDFAGRIQLDVMDGVFVPNASIVFDFTLPKADTLFEAHLMIGDPHAWIRRNSRKVDVVLVHVESCGDPRGVIDALRGRGRRVGFALNPETPVRRIEKYLGLLDQVLVLTVNPGFYGNPFLPEALEKVRALRKMKPSLDIEVDGGITPETIRLARRAGANMFVVGSYVMKSEDAGKAIASLRTSLKQEEA